MKIEALEGKHLKECAALLMAAYNCEPWENQWSSETSEKYLEEFMTNPRFKGFVVHEEEKLVGAAFCHERTWWTADELYVDEFYISPAHQGRGYGSALLKHIEGYIKAEKLAGFTLLTNKFMPALSFYKKHGFVLAEHVVFMYKEV